jgi:hypothetical protein
MSHCFLQSPWVQQYNIYIDHFRKKFAKENQKYLFIITHAHSDHTIGLKTILKQENRLAKILCSKITYELILATLEENEECEKFKQICETIEPDGKKQFQYKFNRVDIGMDHAYHCSGSTMVRLRCDKLHTLFTSDFRWCGELEAYMIQHSDWFNVKHVYLDSSFESFNVKFKTYDETANIMHDALTNIFEDQKGDKQVQVHVHMRILGFEPIIRGYLKNHPNLKWSLRGTKLSKKRQKQIQYLLDTNNMANDNEKTNILILDDFFDPGHTGRFWIKPSCLRFFCEPETETPGKAKVMQCHENDNCCIKIIPFCSHSSQDELIKFKQKLPDTVTIIPCHKTFSTKSMVCNSN